MPGALALVVAQDALRYAPGAALCRAFWFAGSVQRRGAISGVWFRPVAGRVGLSMAMGAFTAGVLLAVRNIVMRWRSDIEPLLLLGCSLLASACRLISARWWRITRSAVIVGPFLAIKSSCCGWSRGRWALPAKQRRWFAVLSNGEV